MIIINKYISDLLYLHDCVIVPGLGGFVANYREVEIREAHNLFMPPVKEIGFNRSLFRNDGLLTDFIALKESVSYAGAIEHIKQFVENIRLQISSGAVVDLGDIGSLRKDAMGNILFIPREGVSFLPESIGLTSFRFMPLEQKKITRIEFLDESDILKNRKSRNWVAAAVFAACFTLFSTELKMPFVSQAGVNDIFSISSNNTEQPFLSKTEIIAVDEETFEPINSVEKTINSVKSYHLIAGSFKGITPANIALNEFSSDEFPDLSLLNDGKGRIRISLCSYSNKAEAIEYLDKLKKQSRFSTVWVFTHNVE